MGTWSGFLIGQEEPISQASAKVTREKKLGVRKRSSYEVKEKTNCVVLAEKQDSSMPYPSQGLSCSSFLISGQLSSK